MKVYSTTTEPYTNLVKIDTDKGIAISAGIGHVNVCVNVGVHKGGCGLRTWLWTGGSHWCNRILCASLIRTLK